MLNFRPVGFKLLLEGVSVGKKKPDASNICIETPKLYGTALLSNIPF
jgi:hypothetical protein